MKTKTLVALLTTICLFGLTATGLTQDNSANCTRSVAMALANQFGVSPYDAKFVHSWWKKNASKYPDICLSQAPKQGGQNFLLVISTEKGYFNGVYPTVVTTRSTSTTPYTTNGIVSGPYGNWTYSSSGIMTTTTTTKTQENVPYVDTNRYLYINAYSSTGALVSSASHLYSSRSGGDAANTAGYNTGFLIAAMGARGRMLTGLFTEISHSSGMAVTNPVSTGPVGTNPPQERAQATSENVLRWFDEPEPDQNTQVIDLVVTATAYDGVINVLRTLRASDTTVQSGMNILDAGYRPATLNLGTGLAKGESITVFRWDDEPLGETTPAMHLTVTRKLYENVTNVIGHIHSATFAKP